jgi:primosomal protein N' (replication factor Y) (superfamily II helicase)
MAFHEDSTFVRPKEALYADVIVPRHIAKAFTYLVPLTLAHTIEIGHRVLVPFGRAMVEGVVISLSHLVSPELKNASLKEIRSLVHDKEGPTLSPALLELSRKIAEYYVAPWGQCLRLVVSPLVTRETSPTRYVATEQGRVVVKTGSCPDHLRPTLNRIARRTSGILSSTLLPSGRSKASQTIDTLLEQSWIIREPVKNTDHDSRKRDGKLVADEQTPELPVETVPTEMLPELDTKWGPHISQCLRSDQMKKIVLHAPWQHQITRLVEAIRQAHALKRSTIVLTGEIARALWLKQLLSRLTGLPTIFAHPSSSSDQCQQDHLQAPSIVVGTRSAVFAPLTSIGLLWVDGEEGQALKELQEPRYHARQVACQRAESERALVVLASAHPSLESRFDAEAEMYHVEQEVHLRPRIELVDLRYEPSGTLFSQKLISAMHETLGSHAKILLFLNRKGYARTLVCRDCGWVPRCASCVVPLTYYREVSRLSCRYCGVANGLPDVCPMCRAPHVSPIGDGTERVQADTHRLFPHARIIRLDGDTLRRPASARSLWERIRSGAWDILIGTQALFGRQPLPQHGLVGILQADSGLHVSDFRAAERTYHVLIDAASLAYPASAGGRVIVQTRLPTHHAVQALMSGNPHQFYTEELAARQLLNYPPSCHLADLSVTGKNIMLVKQAAEHWRTELEKSASPQDSITVLGPVATPSRRPPGHHHHRILVKGIDSSILARRIHDSVQQMERAYRKGHIKFIVDMDPVESG